MSAEKATAGIEIEGGAAREAGFTLVELLVVVLILGIMAAIALPAFFNQQPKSGDAQAMDIAASARVAMEKCGESRGGFSGCDLEALRAIDSGIPTSEITVRPGLPVGGYTIAVTGDGGQVFTIEQGASGDPSYTCTRPGEGGCAAGGAGAGVWHG